MLINLYQRFKLAAKVLIRGEGVMSSRSTFPPITLEEVAEAKIFFPMEKFFIFGFARSGTTLLNRLVRVHPDVHSNRQAHFFTRPPFLQSLVADQEVEEWLQRRSVRWNRGRDLSPVVMRAVADYILERDARKEGKTIVGDKSPSNLMHGEAVRLMHNIYPDARLIYIVRDGRDAVLSHRFQAFIDATQYLTRQDWKIRDAFVQDSEVFKFPDQSLFTPGLMRRYTEDWVKNISETGAAGNELYSGKYLHIRFEDLIAEPTTMMRQVWGFLGADLNIEGLDQIVLETQQVNRDAKWQAEKAGNLAKSIPKGGAGSWREFFSNQDKTIFKEIAGEMLVKWGYEQDLNW